MTNYILRFLAAVILVTFSVTSALANGDDTEDSDDCTFEFLDFEYCKKNPQKYASTCSGIDACRRDSKDFEALYQAWLKSTASGSSAKPQPAPVVHTQSNEQQVTSATVPVNHVSGGTFPSSMYPASPDKQWKSIGQYPNKAKWGAACDALVKKTAGSSSSLPAEVCILFASESYGLDPVNGSGSCHYADIPNGVVIDGQVYGLNGKIVVWTNIQVQLKEGSVRRTKVCHAGVYGERELYVIQPDGCANYSFIWVAGKKTPGPCQYREVYLLVYDRKKLTDPKLQQAAEDMRAGRNGGSSSCGAQKCEPAVTLRNAQNALMQDNKGTLLATLPTFKVSLVKEGADRGITEEMSLAYTVDRGAVRFLVPWEKEGWVIRVVAENGSFFFPVSRNGNAPEMRCATWRTGASCSRRLFLSMVLN